MRALIVFESMFGNTQAIAQRVGEGLSTLMDVEVVEVGTAPAEIPDNVELLVVGAHTHAFSLSRPATRKAAGDQAVDGLVSKGDGLREWLATPPRVGRPLAGATFDTKVRSPHLPGSAAKAAYKRLGRLGFRIVIPAHTFYVGGTKGPLLDGEAEQALIWGEHLAATVAGVPRS